MLNIIILLVSCTAAWLWLFLLAPSLYVTLVFYRRSEASMPYSHPPSLRYSHGKIAIISRRYRVYKDMNHDAVCSKDKRKKREVKGSFQFKQLIVPANNLLILYGRKANRQSAIQRTRQTSRWDVVFWVSYMRCNVLSRMNRLESTLTDKSWPISYN